MLMLKEDRTVDVPEGESGSVKIEKFTVTGQDCVHQMRDILSGRGVPPGTCTKLLRNGRLWMSDTPAEWRDHSEAFFQMQMRGGRVLVNGLGIGMIVKAALALPNIEHVDVVEVDLDVIKLAGPTYVGPRCTIHHADALQQMRAWPRGTRWTVAWHDIWENACEDQMPERSALKRSYGRRVAWQGCWGDQLIRRGW